MSAGGGKMMFTYQEIVRHTAEQYDKTHHWWEWQIPVYLFLGGIVAGVMVLTAVRYLMQRQEERGTMWRWMAWMPPVLLSIGMFALWLDLSSKLNAWRFYLVLQWKAPMSWGAWILILVYPATILFALGEKRLLEKWTWLNRLASWAEKKRIKDSLAWSNIALGVVLGIYTGILLSNMMARPLWNSAILGPLFLVSGLSTGAAFMLLFRLRHSEKQFLGKLDIGLITLEIVLLLLFVLSLVNGAAIQQEAVSIILGGEYTAWFWSFVFIIGLAAPLALTIFELATGRPHTWVIPAMVLIGGFALRWILVYAGQAQVW